jgi:aerobic C4-dicarboxylate transport protein
MSTMATTPRDDLGLEQTVKPRKKALWSNLGLQVAVSMVLGIIVGLVWPEFGASLKILGDIFLRLIKTAVAPLVFPMAYRSAGSRKSASSRSCF